MLDFLDYHLLRNPVRFILTFVAAMLVLAFALAAMVGSAHAGSYSSSRSSFSSSRSYSSPSRSYSAPKSYSSPRSYSTPKPSYSKPTYVAPRQPAYSPRPRSNTTVNHYSSGDSGSGLMNGLLLGTIIGNSGNHSAPAPVIINGGAPQAQQGIAPTPQSTYIEPSPEPKRGLSGFGFIVLLFLVLVVAILTSRR
jgi:hypothetical protein